MYARLEWWSLQECPLSIVSRFCVELPSAASMICELWYAVAVVIDLTAHDEYNRVERSSKGMSSIPKMDKDFLQQRNLCIACAGCSFTQIATMYIELFSYLLATSIYYAVSIKLF